MGQGARKSLACLWRRQNQEGASCRERFVSIPRAGKKLLEYLVFIVLFRGVWGRRCDQPHDVKCESHLRVKGTRQGVGSGEFPDSRLRGRAALPEMGRGENRAVGQLCLEFSGPSLSLWNSAGTRVPGRLLGGVPTSGPKNLPKNPPLTAGNPLAVLRSVWSPVA